MKKALLMLIAVSLLSVACSSAPKPPSTVDGSQREPVNKTLMKDQMGATNGK